MSDFPEDIEVLGFQARGLERPNRVYSHKAHGQDEKKWYVGFSPVGERYPVMFLYIDTFEEAVALVREIASDTRAGNVDKHVGRWNRNGREE